MTDVADHNRYRPERSSDSDIDLGNHFFHIYVQRHAVLHKHVQRPSSAVKHRGTCRGPR